MIQKKPQNDLFCLKNEEKKHFSAEKFGGIKKRNYFCNPVWKRRTPLYLVHCPFVLVLGPFVHKLVVWMHGRREFFVSLFFSFFSLRLCRHF